MNLPKEVGGQFVIVDDMKSLVQYLLNHNIVTPAGIRDKTLDYLYLHFEFFQSPYYTYTPEPGQINYSYMTYTQQRHIITL
jgi:hypothetical protein